MDVESRELFWREVGWPAAAGRTILFATHYLAGSGAIRKPSSDARERSDRRRRHSVGDLRSWTKRSDSCS